MKLFVHLLFTLLICTNLQSQKIYWKSSYPKANDPVGGVKGVKEMIKQEFEFPAKAITAQVEGSVTIRYSVLPNGELKLGAMSGTKNEHLINETIRLLKKVRFVARNNRPFSDNSETFTVFFSNKDWVKLSKKRGYKAIDYPFTPVDTTEKLYSFQLLKTKPYPVFSEKENYAGFNDYIANKLQYPDEALKLGLKGDVVITFVIEQSGHVTNIQVLKRLGAGCTEEAIRLIEKLSWYPGIKDGQAIRTLMVSSIGFGVRSSQHQGAFNQGAGGR